METQYIHRVQYYETEIGVLRNMGIGESPSGRGSGNRKKFAPSLRPKRG